jgi:hypothetical protein
MTHSTGTIGRRGRRAGTGVDELLLLAQEFGRGSDVRDADREALVHCQCVKDSACCVRCVRNQGEKRAA